MFKLGVEMTKKSLTDGRTDDSTKDSAILKIAAILKTCEKNFPIFSNFKALIFTQNVAKYIQNTRFC
jgi:hypothetical protein